MPSLLPAGALAEAVQLQGVAGGANGKLYLASEEGDVIVVRMGEKFEILATNTLDGQKFIAPPAIAAGKIFLRSQDTLFCVPQAKK